MTSEFNRTRSGFKKFLSTVQNTASSSPSSPSASRKEIAPHSSKFYTLPSPSSPAMVEKKGWLKLYSGKFVSSWSARWIVLAGEQLFYYASQDESKQASGQIFLPGNTIIEHPYNANEPLKFVFEISSAAKPTLKSTVSSSTYLLCCESDDIRKDWVRSIKHALYGKIGGAIFGCRLDETLRIERKKCASRKVPELVQMCVEFLLQYGLECEGLFRLPGRTAFVKQLRNSFDSGERHSFESLNADVHSVASLLKGYLRELPEPVIPVAFYEPIMHVVLRELNVSPDEGIEKLTKSFASLPLDSYNLLQYLCWFLSMVGKNWEVNKMSPMNLATVFSQSFIQPEDDDPALLMGTADGRTRAVFVMISQVDKIFSIDHSIGGEPLLVNDLPTFANGITRDNAEMNGTTLDFTDPEFNEYMSHVNNTQPPLLTPDIIRDTATAVATATAAVTDSTTVAADSSWNEKRAFKGLSLGSQKTNAVFFGNGQVPRSNVEGRSHVKGLSNDVAAHALSTSQKGPGIISSMNSVDITELDRDDLVDYVIALREELKREGDVVTTLNTRLKDLETRHVAQVEGFSKRLDEERAATKDAVSHVMDVKTQLETYILKYGPIQ